MRDLERKVNKFVNARASEGGKKSRGVSPMFSPTASTGFSTAGQSAKITKTVNSRTFSMTVTFNPQVNARFDGKKSKDIAIHHQENKQRAVTAKPFDHAKSPKRNPILQDGQEPCYEFKPPMKATPMTGKMTIFNEESPIKKRADGECKNFDHARSVSPPAPCIKTRYPRAMREDMSPDTPRRLRKGPTAALKKLTNPIVEGDLESLKMRRVRKGAVNTGPSEETKKLNDRNQLLATDIGYSPKGRVYRDSSLTGFAQSTEDPVQVKSKRFASPQFRKPTEMHGLLQYSYSGVFRQEQVSPKCTASSFYDIVKGLSSSQMF